MAYKYSFQNYNKEKMAKAVGVSMPISAKKSREICKHLKDKTVVRARTILTNVIGLTEAIPYTKFNRSMPHHTGIGPGGYPVKACENILAILNSAAKNAEDKGLNVDSLTIVHMSAQKASRPMHYGRHRGLKQKRTHIEIVLEERSPAPKKNDTKEKKTTKKTEPKEDKK